MAAVSEPEPPEEKSNAPAVSPAVPWPAAVAERYECRKKLGHGLFGDVYKAWDRESKRFVAVKQLSGRTDDRFVATPLCDFEREVMSLAACRGHPSVVEILAAYRADGDSFIVTEYAGSMNLREYMYMDDRRRKGQPFNEGEVRDVMEILAVYADYSRADGDCFVVTEYAGPENLREYMDRRRNDGQPFDEGEVRDVMAQLLAGAWHAQMAGVLHRDIVPENVIVDKENGRMVYKICGFGMSEPPAAQAEEKDDSGMLACSSPYRAPELFLGSKDYDHRVDTWSLGCIMAELVAGDGMPFFAAPDGEVFKTMLQVVGAKGIVEWRGLERVASPEKAARLRKMGRRERGYLKKKVKKLRPHMLSPAGFKVLEGLLDSNPDRRLSADAALRMPWFQTSSAVARHGAVAL